MFNLKLSRLFGKLWPARGTSGTPVRKRVGSPLRLESLEDRTVLSSLLGTTANTFAVLGSSTVTNTGPTIITGNVGVSPGSAVVGFPPGIVTPPGTIHAADAVALRAQRDTTIAYNDLAGRPRNFTLTGQNLGGLTLTPGVYRFSSSARLTGTLTLDFQGNPDALFIFQIGSTLTTASNSSVAMINGGNGEMPGCEVYWKIGSSATLGTGTTFVGNIVALTSITLNTGATILSGRALARTGAVTLDTNEIIPCGSGSGGVSGGVFGVKFNDLNGNGVRNAGEPGLQGWTIFLDVNRDGVRDAGETRITDANGNYTFAGLLPGTYRVREVGKLGWVQMTNNPPDIVITELGQNVRVRPFGNAQAVTLFGPSKINLIGQNMDDGVLARQARFVANLYQGILGEAPDRAGLTYYVRLLQAGFSQQQVAALFMQNQA